MKKLLSLLSVVTISGTAMPSVIAVSNYQKEVQKFREEAKAKKIHCYKKNIENLENRLNQYHKLNNTLQEHLAYYINNKDNFISGYGEEWFNNKIDTIVEQINEYINNLISLSNEIKILKNSLKNLVENQKEN